MKEIKEDLAELCHTQWSGWMKYLFSKSTMKDGECIIPRWATDRWLRQSATDYHNLTNDEKESDRKEADKFIVLFEKRSNYADT